MWSNYSSYFKHFHPPQPLLLLVIHMPLAPLLYLRLVTGSTYDLSSWVCRQVCVSVRGQIGSSLFKANRFMDTSVLSLEDDGDFSSATFQT